MKQETKKKLCKISKIVGFAITFGFAVFGVLCAAMLIGNGSKKDDIKTLDSSLVLNEVRSGRNSKPRKAPDYQSGLNLLEEVERVQNVSILNGDHGLFVTHLSSYVSGDTYYSGSLKLASGYYYFRPAENNIGNWSSGVCGKAPNGSFAESCNDALSNPDSRVFILDSFFLFSSDTPSYFYWSPEDANNKEFVFSSYFLYSPYLTLVDTLDLPSSSSISFPDSFSPLGLFGDSVTNNGGYIYLPQAEGNELDIEITGLIFKYGGVVYDGIHIELERALSLGYINDDGQLVPQGGANDYMWALGWIKFYQRFKGQSPQDGMVVVMAELKSVTGNANNSPVAFTGRTQWVNRSDRTIQIIDDLGTTTGRYDNRYTNMTDKHLLEWMSSSFSIGNSLGVMGDNSVFDIFTNAFDSVLPILSIAILPNITLGMLLFIPLIGAIIVIIIRVVKK